MFTIKMIWPVLIIMLVIKMTWPVCWENMKQFSCEVLYRTPSMDKPSVLSRVSDIRYQISDMGGGSIDLINKLPPPSRHTCMFMTAVTAMVLSRVAKCQFFYMEQNLPTKFYPKKNA